MNFKKLIRTSWRGIILNKLRTGLTMSGIIIGVASVISMLALGNGARKAVENQFRGLGANVIQASQRLIFEDGSLSKSGKILSYEDGLLLEAELTSVERVDMSVNTNARIRNKFISLDMTVQGVTGNTISNLVSGGQLQPVDFPEGRQLTANAFLQEGRFFSKTEVLKNEEICVLGSDTALELFQGDSALGAVVQVGRVRCVIIGVLSELESVKAEDRYSSNPNLTLYMPVGTVIQNFYKEEPSVYMSIFVKDAGEIDRAKDEIVQFLRKRHEIEVNEGGKYQDDFELTSRKDILGAQQDAAKTFSLLLTAMAIVSLLVGGIGIMNVMLVSVTERTKEIGVRLAVGAQRRDIVSQFLLEAILISAVSGVLGIVLGILSIPLAASLNQGIAVLAIESIPLSFFVALFTGSVFGFYPALRASKLDPIICLRYE